MSTVDRLAGEFIEAGVRIDREPGRLDTPGEGYGFRCFDPDGRLLEISADVTPRAARQLDEGESIPVRISHVVINSPDLAATKRFYEERLGFVLRDWLGDFMCFLQIGPDHHVLAITAAPHVSFNHVSFEMRGLDEFLRGTGRLTRNGIRPVWGPGRHGPGNNTFSYFVDPAGNVAEYTHGLQQIADPSSYPVRTWDPGPEESDLWGTAGPFEEYLPYALGVPDPLVWTASPV
jgi:catechol 2,3-dioxygenase-like lactoylglutathione lyase family enzyme